MHNYLKGLLLLFLCLSFSFQKGLTQNSQPKSYSEFVQSFQKQEGFFNFYWDDDAGKIWLEIDKLETEFLYVNSLAAGVGSNDIGLDRGQLGDDHVVKFVRSGNKILLTQINLKYRAISDNIEERLSVEQAFAQSVLWGFKVEKKEDGRFLVDATKFFLRDAHDVIGRLKGRKQGKYKLDEGRSAMFLDRTKNFPKNTEFEATLTFTGDPDGQWIRSVTPSPRAVTVRQHHSFVELPDDQYQPRKFDPRSGYNALSYSDYATPIEQPLVKKFIVRHRLEKKDPSARVSEAVEPIIYYVDRGAPEPIKSALIEGASWWNQAFEAAGYKDAFQVKELPPEADPMDVRYNLIQWVHRSTRGWSYGASVKDPRTGEIIKGHVSLGSLRVRQDFLIAQGLFAAYEEDGKTPDPKLMKMALARLRQLSAHEVGHTIGLAHNFAASYNDRASVMDYPHPVIQLDENGNIDFSNAYDDKIGAWDKRTILFGYQDFPKGTDEEAALQEILSENDRMGLKYISDQDARPPGGAHPSGHLWDNGASPAKELERMAEVRAKGLKNFGLNNIAEGLPLSHLENVLVPLYLSHRYQVEAVSKLIGGVEYEYYVNNTDLKSRKKPLVRPVSEEVQKEALSALLSTLETEYLAIPEHILELIPPQPIGYRRDRELFKTHTAMVFDPLGAAESSANNTIKFLLNPQRLARVVEQSARNNGGELIDLSYIFGQLFTVAFFNKRETEYEKEVARVVEKLAVQYILNLAGDKKGNQQVTAAAIHEVIGLKEQLNRELEGEEDYNRKAHLQYLLHEIEHFQKNPDKYKMPKAPELPAGSPIGCGH